MENEFLLIPATLPYLEKLRQIAIRTFMDTYAAMNTHENMRAYIDQSFSQERMAAELQSPLCQYWLAMSGEQLLGYMKINFGEAQTDLRDLHSVELERIYVLPAHKGKGVGATLIRKAVEIAKAHGKQEVWLGVWEKNESAILFYEKMGFVKTGRHVFLLGEDEQSDHVMRFFI